MNNNLHFDLRHLKAFMAIADTLHFKKAADKVCITQPAFSRLIKGLEEAVGAELLARTTRKVELTEAGRLFRDECHEALSHLERGVHLAQSADQGDIGSISIAYNDFSINGVLPEILDHFKEEHPYIKVQLSYMPSHEQHIALKNRDIDVGFLIGPLALPGVETHCIAVENIVVILPKRHPLADRKSVRLDELAKENFILGTESGWQEFRSYVLNLCMKAGFTPNVIQEASTSNGIFGLVAANMGVSLFSECVERFNRKDIVVVPLENGKYNIETIAAWDQSYISPSFGIFRDLLQSELNI